MPSSNRPIPYSKAVETIPLDEVSDIQQMIQAVEKVLERQSALTGTNQGEVHVKTHGFAEAEFRILPNLPSELTQGLFGQSHTYSAVVRFSNSSSQARSDALPDGRGIAIKIRSVNGEGIVGDESQERTQDFLMVNHPVFFAKSVKDYLRVQEVLAHDEANPMAKFSEFLTRGDWNPLRWNWSELITAARIIGKVPLHLAGLTYFSMTPFRFGDFVAKYRIQPAGDRDGSLADLVRLLSTKVDAFRLALEETLKNRELLFEFQVQLRNNASTMPVEDPTVEWPEDESAFRTVAHLLLPRQDIEQFRHKPEYRSLSFNVWHSLRAHRPLGGINRSRRAVYALSSAWRAARISSPAS